MPTTKSAKKRHRQSLERRRRNRSHRTTLRTRIKSFRKAIDAGDVDTARGMLRSTLALVDHSAKLGVIHDNAAARTKSRLTRALDRASS